MTELTADVNFEKALSNTDVYNQAMVVAKSLSSSKFVPKDFQGSPSDCLIALIMSEQMKTNPVTLMQEMYIVHGKPAFSAKFMISMANKKGPFSDVIRYEVTGSGSTLAARAYAPLKDGTTAESTVTMEMAKLEGWPSKNSKYKSMPEHMLKYRAAAFLVRQYCPEVMMGFQTAEEIKDTYAAPVEVKRQEITEAIETVEAVSDEWIEQRNKMMQAFATLKEPQTEPMILDFLQKSSVDEIDEEDMDKLRIAYTSIKDQINSEADES